MRGRIKAWISRYLVDTSIEIQKLREMTLEIKLLNDAREKQVADFNNTESYWRYEGSCGRSKREEI